MDRFRVEAVSGIVFVTSRKKHNTIYKNTVTTNL